MSRFFILLTLFFFTLNFTFQNWTEYKSFEGKFRVVTPGELTEKVDSIETEVGKLAYHTFVYQPKDIFPIVFSMFVLLCRLHPKLFRCLLQFDCCISSHGVDELCEVVFESIVGIIVFSDLIVAFLVTVLTHCCPLRLSKAD